jgi:CBS domain-containing protein
MEMVIPTYLELKEIRVKKMSKVAYSHFELNQLHDNLMVDVIRTALFHIEKENGPLPCPFSFFVMGSAGRFEQAIWSDQDHGLIYRDPSETAKNYFLSLGKEISSGLFQLGYEYCDGDVMASNPIWCHSISEWKQQLENWVMESSWESIRHLLIFIDGRSLFGEQHYVEELKRTLYKWIKNYHLLPRIFENTVHVKKGLNVLGQFLVESHGTHTGYLNVKEKVIFPYVNAIRMLAIKENLLETSTLSRIQALSEQSMPSHERILVEKYFQTILQLRLTLGDHTNYDSGHYLAVDRLDSSQKRELKEQIRFGNHYLHSKRKLVVNDEHE